MSEYSVGMNYCRRCGSELQLIKDHKFICKEGHIIFANSEPAVALFLFNSKGEVVVIKRGIEPGMGKLDFPGGFCDSEEALDKAIFREVEEEIGISPNQYSNLEFLYSGIDPYEYGGEVLPVVSTVFMAMIEANDIELRAGDDAASAEFVSLEKIPLEDVFFPVLKQALSKARNHKNSILKGALV